MTFFYRSATLVTLCSTLTCAAHQPAAQEAAPRVEIETGAIAGKIEGSIRTFLGIPYAAPPVGDLRWKPPAAAAHWTGARKADEFGARCMQGPIFSNMSFRDRGASEDCLTLNVWTAAKDATEKLPVMVWIHGGGHQAGASSEPRQDGQFLAKRGVVVVSMNYRLGVFGYLVLPDLAEESGRNAAGNYGLLDQLAALQWVQRNIAAFGGDPANVTIFGESAGSFSVSAQMASPLARGSFTKAIGESGAAFFRIGTPSRSLPDREKADAEFAKSALGTSVLKELRAMPAQKILDATMKTSERGFQLGPNVDGYFLPQPVAEIFAAGKQNDVPLLAGWNLDEGGSSAGPVTDPQTIERLNSIAKEEFGAKAAEFLRVYPGTDDAVAKRSLHDFAGDRFIAWATWRWLERASLTGKKPVYRYRFDRSFPSDIKKEGLGAYHSAEIEYVFGTLDAKSGVPWRPEDRALSDEMQRYWVNFARAANPNGRELPKWPVYNAKDGWQVMFLNSESKAGKDLERDRYLFLTTVWGK
jgi:para-nitrobenzyl esterase